jgi:regulator of extracellular matrix RemA (YlzA/DUF370 family)
VAEERENNNGTEITNLGSLTRLKGGPRLPDPEFVSIGFGSMVAMNRVLTLLSPDTAPVRRLLHEARDKGLLIDATYGRKTKAVLVLDSGHVLIAALTPETITGRYLQKQGK